MLIHTLTSLYNRDLSKLKTEIQSYNQEENLWKVKGEISNSAGNLCLHLIGNLNAFIGGDLGKTGYVRDRPFEFEGKNVPREKLISQIDEISQIVEKTINNLTEEDLLKPFEKQVFGHEMTTGYFLVHLATHLGYHLGQINYHRRLLDA